MSERMWKAKFVVLMTLACTFLYAGRAHAEVATCSHSAPALGAIGAMVGTGVSTLLMPIGSELADNRDQYAFLPNTGWTFLSAAGSGALGVLLVTATGCDASEQDLGAAYAFTVPMLLSFVGAGVVQAFLWDDEVALTMAPALGRDFNVQGVVGHLSLRF